MASTLTSAARSTAGDSKRMHFLDRTSCLVVWPDGEPSLADLAEGFESLGLRPATHRPEAVEDGTGSVHRFTFEPASFSDSAMDKIADAFDAAISGRTQLDMYSRLIGAVDISWPEVNLLRAICRFLVQANIGLSEAYMVEVLASQPDFVEMTAALFAARFDPYVADRQTRIDTADRALDVLVEGARTLDQDRIMRGVRSFVSATLRTNWFQTVGGVSKTYASFKLDSSVLDVPVITTPFREIFVHGPEVEGVHLRTSSVARGGLRWSDRLEDYRTEALSLMKTQSVKNSPIVPSGAKGAFIVRGKGPDSVRTAYSTFIRGLLDVTDNIVDGRVVREPSTVAYDGEDAYLVVAADKGTAAFSDVANAIADEYGFWLGDAFASGGSKGYDHKAMGITARGAWVAVRRHFLERGLDVDTDEFTAVGIGDMSGDVFGNGMLLGAGTKLVAAFDHRHIFLDPHPDCAVSYAERQRLFRLPGSNWSDYDPSLISPGGGVWPRQSKSVPLSSEMGSVLGVDSAALTPHALIRAILSAPVDLLWNGGVGTYVKASTETHLDAADPANDAVRIDADALRASVVGEGGNLGFTQRARIEFAGRGGRINADFIDNAAGVATSDREVNIKIALDSVGALDTAARDAMLESVGADVCAAVLEATADQTLAISVAERRAPSQLDQHQRLIDDLVGAGLIDRQVEALPDDSVFSARSRAGTGLFRPELALLVAQSKNMVTAELLDSDVPDNAVFADRLGRYFPAPIADAAGDGLRSHRLARQIVATSIADELVNRIGPGALYRLEDRFGSRSPRAALAYAVVSTVLRTEDLRRDILAASMPEPDRLRVLERVQQVLESEMSWVLRRPGASGRFGVNAESDIVRWSGPVAELQTGGSLLARTEALFGALSFADASLQSGEPIERTATTYQRLARELDIVDLLNGVEVIDGASHWEVMGSAATRDRMRDRFADLVTVVVDDGDQLSDPARSWVDANSAAVQRFATLLSKVRRAGTLDTARLCTVDAELELLAR